VPEVWGTEVAAERGGGTMTYATVDYIRVGTRKFARNNSLLVDSLFHSDGTCSGTFRVKRGKGRVAVELRNLQNDPIALVSPDGCLVTASRLSTGKTFYMYAMTANTYHELGIPESIRYSDERAIGKAIIDCVSE
jgi:hypothetical protein